MMKKNKAKKIATWIIVPLMAAIFLLDIATVLIGNGYCRKYMPTAEEFDGKYGDDRIHFLNTANSDAILLESNGHFALIDAGEGSSNPRKNVSKKGFEKEVIAYLKKVASDENGKVYLDFILGTHCHYDHIGSFKAIIDNDDIVISRAYFKKFNPDIAKDYEIKRWNIGGTYDDIISSLNRKNVNIFNDIPTKPFKFGAFTVNFVNTETPDSLNGKGENASSIGTVITKNGKKAFLAGDITRSAGNEKLVAPLVGDVDLLKAGHHGYYGSSSAGFLKTLKPEIIIVTNQLGKVYPNVKWNFTMIAKAPFFATYDCNGIIANFTDDGRIVLTDNIH